MIPKNQKYRYMIVGFYSFAWMLLYYFPSGFTSGNLPGSFRGAEFLPAFCSLLLLPFSPYFFRLRAEGGKTLKLQTPDAKTFKHLVWPSGQPRE